MITFVPTTDMEEIAKCLDDKRLGAQRYESYLILKWLREGTSNQAKAGYCTMWKGYEPALVKYVNIMLREWDRRGKNNLTLKPNMEGLEEPAAATEVVEMPPWWGNEILHSYHRHALLKKFPQHYKKFGWKEDGTKYNGSYMWPVQLDDDEENNIGSGGGGEWILRWPKALKLPSIPISTAAAAAVTTTKKKTTTTKKKERATPEQVQQLTKSPPPKKVAANTTTSKRKRKSVVAVVVTPDRVPGKTTNNQTGRTATTRRRSSGSSRMTLRSRKRICYSS